MTSELRDVLIVGASLAGLRAAETLRDEGYSGALTIIGDEDVLPYDRPPLSKDVLRGEMEPPDTALSMAEGLRATWRLGERATSLDVDRRLVVTATGEEVPFGGLVLATGSGARGLPVFDPAAPNVHMLRRVEDALRLRDVLRDGTRLLIVGCGFIGVEVAASARSLGAEVTVASLDPPLAQAGPLVTAAAARLMERAGVRLFIGRTITSVSGEDGLRVSLDDGTVLEADHVVVAVGSVPNIGWLEGSGIELGDGVACDSSLRVRGTDRIVAAGDIVRWPNPAFGGLPMRIEHWSNAVEQGGAAARTLVRGTDAPEHRSVPNFWSDHFGIRLQSVGLPGLADRFEILAGSPDEDTFAAAAYAGETLVGAVAYGMPRKLVPVRAKLAKSGVTLSPAQEAARQ